MIPFFSQQILHPMTYTQRPNFTTAHTQWPPFSKFQPKISNFLRPSSALKYFVNFHWFSAVKRRIFTQIWQKLHWMTPYFGKFSPKMANLFLIPHPMTFFFLWNPTLNAPCFRSPVGTLYTSHFHIQVPPPPSHQHDQIMQNIVLIWFKNHLAC